MPIPTLGTYGGTTLIPGFQGQVSETGPVVIRSAINTSATAIDFGVAVGRGASTAAGQTDRCVPIVAGTEVVFGISVRNAGSIIASTDGNNTVNYAQYQAVPVMTTGVVYVTVGETVAEGDTALFIVASSRFGSVQTGALAGSTRIAVPTATFLDPGTNGSLVRLHINSAT